MAQIIVDVKSGGLESAHIESPFDEGKEVLEQAGYRIISLEENARLRMQEGANSKVSKFGNRTREGVLYIPDKGAFLSKKSPIMQNAKEAVECHRNRKDFYLSDAQIQEALADSVKLSGKAIPTNRFKDNEITKYAFGNEAEKYGEFLKDAGIQEMPIWLAYIQDEPFAKQMWFCRLGYGGRSDLGSLDWDLYDDYWVRGVK